MTDEPISISWSRLRSSSECRAKGYLQRAHKNPSQNIRNYLHGSVADLAMRKWLETGDVVPGQMEQMIDSLIDETINSAKDNQEGVVRWKSQTDRSEMTVYCKDLVSRLEPILNKLILPYDFLSAQRFKVPVQVPWLDGSPTWIYLIGEFDLVTFDELNRYVVWDLKATRDPEYWRKTVGQLIFYDISIGAMFEEYTSKVGLIQPMVLNQPLLEFIVTDAARAEMWARIHRLSTDMWLKDYTPKADSKGCSYCEVKSVCPKFKNVFIDAKGKRRMIIGG